MFHSTVNLLIRHLTVLITNGGLNICITNDIQLIKIEAVVREEMFVDVKKALTDIGVNGITAYQVVGCGIQRGMSEYVRGQKVDVQVLPKIKFEIVVSSEE